MNFDATLTDRKWMKAAKSYRLHFDLDSLEIAVAMTGRIEKNIQMRITHSQYPQIQAVLDPCHIVDVPHKAKTFTLICETCSESQNYIGALLTPVIGDTFHIATSEIGAIEPTAPIKRGTISEQAKKGLHTSFFQNKHFQEYVSMVTGQDVQTPTECKAVYKGMLGVQSCKEINQTDYLSVLHAFNDWLTKRGPVGRG